MAALDSSAHQVSRPFQLAAGRGWVIGPVAVAVLVSLPVAVVVWHVFVPAGEVWRHLAATVLDRYIVNTVFLVIGVGLGSFVIGTGTAWLCSMCRFPGRGLFEWAMLLPLAVPTYAIGFTYAGLLDYAGPVQTALRGEFGWGRADYWFPDIRSLGGIIVLFSLVLYPYVFLLARAAFIGQSQCALEIARTLGRGPWRAFFEVGLPLARPALVGGTALAVMEALSDFGTVQYFGVDTFTTGIYRTWFGLGDPAAAAQLSAILLLVVLVVLVGEQWSRGRARYSHTTGRYRPLPARRLPVLPATLAFLACALPLSLGFAVPAVQLSVWTIETWTDMVDARFLELAWHSLLLASLTAVLAVPVALGVIYAKRLNPGRLVRSAARVAGMGYAVPGSVIAVGVLLPLAWFDNALDGVMRSWFGVSTGLLLTGGIAALIFGYLARFLAVALNAVDSAMTKVTPAMDGAARTLGAGPGRVLYQIHRPIISGGLLTAALMVFVDVMKELPATLIMRPFNFDTLAVHAFELASDERLADSASAALAIVVVGLAPVIMLSRGVSRSRPGHAALGAAR